MPVELTPFGAVFDWLIEVATSEWVYAVAGGVVLVDGLIGLIPSETVLHAAGVGASRGSTSIVLTIAIATVCASAADLLAYAVGARWGTTLRDKFLRSDRVWSSEKSERKVRGVRAQLDERPWIITVARFVPTLRTVTMYSAGTLEFPRQRFLLHEVPGALLWASFHVLIGYVLGRVFEDTSFWVPFAVSTGIAGALAVMFEVVRRTKLQLEDPGDDGR